MPDTPTPDLPYSAVAFKASHNSYDRPISLAQQLTFDPDRPWQGGCSGIELDIVQKSDAWEWSVSHGGRYSSRPEDQLSAWLEQVVAWAAGEPDGTRRVITIYLDIKNTPLSNTEFPDRIDAYIERVIPRTQVFSPGALIGGPLGDLVSGAQANGWPSLAELQSKFIFVFSGSESRKASYAATDPSARLCFSDLKLDAGDLPDLQRGTRIFMNYHLYSMQYGTWHDTLQDLARQPGFVSRGYVLNSDGIWSKAQSAALNIMATDEVTDEEWAQNGNTPYAPLRLAVPAQ